MIIQKRQTWTADNFDVQAEKGLQEGEKGDFFICSVKSKQRILPDMASSTGTGIPATDTLELDTKMT